MINIITAFDKNGVIGHQGQLLWHCSEDLKYFKVLTSDHVVVMGRKTFDSLNRKPLPERINIVMSKQRLDFDSIITMDSVEEVLKFYASCPPDVNLFIIGGAQIYKLFLPLAHRLYITRIDASFSGDTYFPPYETDSWKLISQHDMKTTQFKLNFEIYFKKEGLLQWQWR